MSDAGFCFILNPAAGGGFVGRNWPELREKLRDAGIEHTCYQSDYRGHARELARAAFESGQRNFVAVGGDGTANEILNGVFGTAGLETAELSLGTVPWGTGNDWARYYGLSRQPDELVESLLALASSRQDIGRVTFTHRSGVNREHYFLNCAGTGFDSYLLNEMGTAQGGRLRYLLFLLKCLRKFRATEIRLELDGAYFAGSALLLEICLGKFAGGGMHFAPAAVADDGRFDVLFIEDLSIPQVLRSLAYLYNGRINQHPGTRSWQCRSVSAAAREGQYLHCDGELVGELPVRIDILPDALRVLRPTVPRQPD